MFAYGRHGASACVNWLTQALRRVVTPQMGAIRWVLAPRGALRSAGLFLRGSTWPLDVQAAPCDAVGKAGAAFESLGDGWADRRAGLMLAVLGGLVEFERESNRRENGGSRPGAKAEARPLPASATPPRLSCRASRR